MSEGTQESSGIKVFYLRRPALAALAALYIGAVFVMGLRAGEPSELWWWPLAIPMLAWVASPIVVGLLLSRFLNREAVGLLYSAALIGIGAYGFAHQWYVMFVGPSDAQNALVMIFDPLLQWLAVGLVFAVAFLSERLVRKS